MMKKGIIFLTVLAAIGFANAAVLVRNNGGFDTSAAGWNAAGGGGAWAPGYVATGGNPGGYITLQSANNTWAVWYQVINEDLAVWGIPAGTTITVQGDMIDLGTLGNHDVGGLKVESWAGALLGELAISFPVTTSWATYSFDYTIAAGATSVKMVVTNVNYDGGGTARFGFDNISIGFPGGLTPALFPIPTVGNTGVAPASDVLSWTNPAPLKNPSDMIKCDVWFRASAAPLADPNLEYEGEKIVTNEAVNSVDLSARGKTLVQDYYYYWKVDIIDPNDGGNPIIIPGFTWSFKTGDAPAVVNAGADQYVWLTAGTKTITLTGTFTDDGKSAVTTTWSVNPLTQTDPATTYVWSNQTVAQGIKTSGTHTATVTVNNTGWFFFDFTATDAAGSSVDTVNVGVYVDACEAANEDPTDIPAKYPNGHGDIDGDCDIDLSDFAIMAASWLDCMSTKLGCL